MPKSALLLIALLCSVGGVAWLALAMEVHWQQVRGTDAGPGRAVAIGLRIAGAVALLASLLVCLRADHASMAALVWVMSLGAAALAIALALAWRPRWLAWWVAWARPSHEA
jgi:hypothetical protein